MPTNHRTLIAATAAAVIASLAGCAIQHPVAIQPAAHVTAATAPTAGQPATTGTAPATSKPTATAPTATTTAPATPGPAATGSGGSGGTQAPTTSPDTTLPDERNAPACLAADLVMEPVEYGGSGMGTTGVGVWVDNHGKRPCYLQGQPALYYRDSHGTLHRLPVNPADRHPARIVVDPTAPAEFWIHHVLGYGGYDPHSAACAHPVVYRNMSVRIGAVRVAVPTLKLDILCGAITVSDWELR